MRPNVDPTPILQMVTAYWGSMTLFAANEVGLFTALSRGPKDAAALAAELNVAERPLRLLLQGAAGLGLLTHQDGRFANTALAEAYLVEGRPAFLGNAIRYGADNYSLWGTLPNVVRTGKPVTGAEDYLGADREKTRNFVWGMHTGRLASPGGSSISSSWRGDDAPGPGRRAGDLRSPPRPEDRRTARHRLRPPSGRGHRRGDHRLLRTERTRQSAGGRFHDRRVSRAGRRGAALRHSAPGARGGLPRHHPEDLDRTGTGRDHHHRRRHAECRQDQPRLFHALALHMLVSSERGGAHAKDEQCRWLEEAALPTRRSVICPLPASTR